MINDFPKVSTKQNEDTKKDKTEDLTEISDIEISAICSNLQKGCEKQYLAEESNLYGKLADYFKSKSKQEKNKDFNDLALKINSDLENELSQADNMAENNSDRGAKRVLTWNRKVTLILKSILEKYKFKGNSFLDGKKVFVCSICGFIYIGDAAPEICPVCKVPKLKFVEIRRD